MARLGALMGVDLFPTGGRSAAQILAEEGVGLSDGGEHLRHGNSPEKRVGQRDGGERIHHTTPFWRRAPMSFSL
jgi:hypothetical protein